MLDVFWLYQSERKNKKPRTHAYLRGFRQALRLLPGAPEALTHPKRSVLQLRGLWLLMRRCSCPQVERNR